jgi:Flp pilus assembly protein TadG
VKRPIPLELHIVRRAITFWQDCRGGAAAELALVLPALAYIALNVTDLCVYIYTKMQVDLGYATTMLNAAQTTSLGTGVTLTGTAENYYCANSSGAFSSTYTYSLGSQPSNCSTAISGSTAVPGDYIQTTASYNFAPVFPGVSIASLLPKTITRTAWMRLQ